jgi:hypothetical protein
VSTIARWKRREGVPLRDVEDSLELKLALDGEVLDGKVVLPVVGERLVERAVLLRGDVARVASPDRLGLVEDVVLLNGLLDLLRLLLLLVVLVLDLLDLGLLGVLLSLLLVLDLLYPCISIDAVETVDKASHEPSRPPW